MTEPVTQPVTAPGEAPAPPDALVAAACALLMAAASLPLARAFIGWEFAQYVGAAILLSLGGQLLARRAGAGGVAGLAVGVVAWVMFLSLTFLSDTLLAGIVPTWETLRGGVDTAADGIELIQSRLAPVPAEPELVLLAVVGVWWIAHAVDVLAVRLRSPLHAIAAALVMWTVPLALTRPPSDEAWQSAVPFLAAAMVLLLINSEPVRRGVAAQRDRRAALPPASGWVTGTGAVVLGVVLVGYVPGFGADALVQPGRASGGLTQTENPIVDIRSRLTELSDQPVARVRSADPVYLRWTSLDRYSDSEQWTNDGISGAELDDALPPETSQPISRFVDTEVEVLGLSDAVLVPAPYQAREVASPRRDHMRWDRDMATLAMATGQRLTSGDRYQVTAAVPDPPADGLRDVDVGQAPPELTHLPSAPDEVVDLASDIVDEAGADNAFDMAMAVQEELRSWEYSLDPPPGHGGSDMVAFITHRAGYCEQYAGTMAVMLRALDIPARVAVGYTPGQPVGEDEFLVRHNNAHAWVEVLFPGFGWISFEPTPRSDQNLLTPSAERMAPTELDSERTGDQEDQADVDFGEDEVPPEQQLEPEPEPQVDGGRDAAGDAAGSDGDDGTSWWWLGAGLASLAGMAGAGTVWTRRRSEHAAMVPAEVVLAHLVRIERLGAGLERPRTASETDAEYVHAIAGEDAAAHALVAAADRARWAPTVPHEAVRSAREAEHAIRRRCLGGLGPLGRGKVVARGWWHAVHRRLRPTALRQRASASRPG